MVLTATYRGHKTLMRVNTTDACIDVACMVCRFRTSAENIEQASRAIVAHIIDTED